MCENPIASAKKKGNYICKTVFTTLLFFIFFFYFIRVYADFIKENFIVFIENVQIIMCHT